MNPDGKQSSLFPKVIFYISVVLLISTVARAWLAEWIYPLDESSLWEKRAYPNPIQEIRRVEWAHRFAFKDPRYLSRLGSLYADRAFQLSQNGLVEGEEDLVLAVKHFKEAIQNRPMVAEYHVGFALFLQQTAALQEKLGRLIFVQNPMRLSEVEVERALFLSPHHHVIRAYAATYFQYRGERDRALDFWRSILEEDPTRIEEVVTKLFKYYQDESFLLEVAPQKRVRDLVRFQEFLIFFHPEGWTEKAYLKTIPLLVEASRRDPEDESLARIIAKSYWTAEEYPQAYFWYGRAFQTAQAPESRAYLLSQMADALMRQRRFLEARALLNPYLDLSSFDPAVFTLYVRTFWYREERAEAFDVMRSKIRQGKVFPGWRDQFALMLYEDGRYVEAVREWRLLVLEIRNTPYEREHLDSILRGIKNCQERLGN